MIVLRNNFRCNSIWRLGAPILGVVLLTACATAPEDCDPTNDSFGRSLLCQDQYERQERLKIELEEDRKRVDIRSKNTHSSLAIAATRLFAGPDMFPPSDFAAYGIVAFPVRSTPQTRQRHLDICEAYTASVLHSYEARMSDGKPLPKKMQMATVWPIQHSTKAQALNEAPRPGVCEPAVDSYGLAVSLTSIGQARTAGFAGTGEGPFLFAWSPSENKGLPDTFVLSMDLSNVLTERDATEAFSFWRNQIQLRPALWREGWDKPGLKERIRRIADKYGPRIANVILNRSE